jgi:hypothetical protein
MFYIKIDKKLKSGQKSADDRFTAAHRGIAVVTH